MPYRSTCLNFYDSSYFGLLQHSHPLCSVNFALPTGGGCPTMKSGSILKREGSSIVSAGLPGRVRVRVAALLSPAAVLNGLLNTLYTNRSKEKRNPNQRSKPIPSLQLYRIFKPTLTRPSARTSLLMSANSSAPQASLIFTLISNVRVFRRVVGHNSRVRRSDAPFLPSFLHLSSWPPHRPHPTTTSCCCHLLRASQSRPPPLRGINATRASSSAARRDATLQVEASW